MKVSVLIPCYKRPDLLKIALSSISNQTLLSSVMEVIVSENGLDKRSEQVCSEFGHLPIRYVYHQVQLKVQDHFAWLLSEVNDGYCALLCDDDWWDNMHIELAMRALTNTEAKCYFSNFIYLKTPNSFQPHFYYGSNGYPLVNNNFSTMSITDFTQSQILTHSFLFTSFHFSSMVCEANVLKNSLQDFTNVSPTVCDRILFANISTNTNILFNPLPTALVRSHDQMDSNSYGYQEWIKGGQEASIYIDELAKKINFSVKGKWNDIYMTSTFEDRKYIERWVSNFYTNTDDLNWFIGVQSISADRKAMKEKSFGKLLRKIFKKVTLI